MNSTTARSSGGANDNSVAASVRMVNSEVYFTRAGNALHVISVSNGALCSIRIGSGVGRVPVPSLMRKMCVVSVGTRAAGIVIGEW